MLSGLLNALDGVAAAEGHILFVYVLLAIAGYPTVLIYNYLSITNHLEQLDPALCHPGHMDV